nr:hypothetical protein [Tanacetum cinerariifolium]
MSNINNNIQSPCSETNDSNSETASSKSVTESSLNSATKDTQESTIDMGNAVHADLVVIESNGTESTVPVDNSRTGNDTDANDAVIKPIYDEEPMAKVQLTTECNIFAIGQQHTEQPEIINDGRVDQYPE